METDFRGANLENVNLAEADFRGANLSGANVRGANLSGAIGVIDGGQRSDGYRFVGVRQNNGLKIAAGCRWMTLSEARKHWMKTRGDTDLGKETFARLDMIEQMAGIYGWFR